jgi:hypothetical protein
MPKVRLELAAATFQHATHHQTMLWSPPQVELVDELEVRNLDTNGDKPEMVNQLLDELITQVRSHSC